MNIEMFFKIILPSFIILAGIALFFMVIVAKSSQHNLDKEMEDPKT